MSTDGVPKDDVKVPESDLGKTMQADFDEGKDLLVTIISAMDEEAVNKSTSCFGFMLIPGDYFFFLCRPFPTKKPRRGVSLRSWKWAAFSLGQWLTIDLVVVLKLDGSICVPSFLIDVHLSDSLPVFFFFPL